jgi:integrase
VATIARRSNRWQVKIRRLGVKVSKTFATRALAEIWARRIESEIEAGVYVAETERSTPVTLSDAIKRYLNEVTPLKRSARSERYLAQAMLRYPMAEMSLMDIAGKHIAQYRDLRLQTVSAPSVRRELAFLSHLFRIARIEWDMAGLANPITDVRKPQRAQARDRRISASEESRLFEAAAQCENAEMSAIIALAIETGMRQSEIIGLEWQHISLSRRVALLPMTKNGERRRVPLSTKAVAILTAMTQSRYDDRVFHYTTDGFRANWARLLRRACITGLRFHDLRHEATSRFFERGLSTMEVAAITGHKSLSMLSRYTHLRAEDIALKLV